MDKSEILEPLHDCLKEILEREKHGGVNIIYTDSDVAAATLMFSQVLGNRLVATLKEEKASIGLSQHLAQTFGEQIQVMAKQMSGVDLSVIYKGKEG